MRISKYVFFRLLFLILVVIPLAAWLIVKPVRIIAPELFGVTCFGDGVCVDDTKKYNEAKLLRTDALSFVSQSISPLKRNPKVIFCFTDNCASKFGLGARSAVTFGTLGTAIGPRAWKPYYVRHELIHQLQGQQLGVLRCLFLPSWFIEGMAYSLSQDPREPLSQPWENYRTKFNQWLAPIGISNIWQWAENE